MTAREFNEKYLGYCVSTQQEAEREAYEVNRQLEVNPMGPALAVYLDGIGWGLMLEVSALTIRRRVH